MMTTLLPPNATAQERAFAEAANRIPELDTPIRELINPDTCPIAVLPWLAWSLSVDEWNSDWSEAQKRAAVKASLQVHQRKGTIGALKSALAAFGYDLSVIEWFEQVPPAQPYTFKIAVEVDQIGIPTATALDQIIRISDSAKNARSRMTGVDTRAISRGGLFLAAVCFLGETVHIEADPST